jgi:hypothetical protein
MSNLSEKTIARKKHIIQCFHEAGIPVESYGYVRLERGSPYPAFTDIGGTWIFYEETKHGHFQVVVSLGVNIRIELKRGLFNRGHQTPIAIWTCPFSKAVPDDVIDQFYVASTLAKRFDMDLHTAGFVS